ncbi:Ppx/GppA phosphatase family protein [Streptococcus uberis]|uniref:Ppx/GppA phosphatase family protein n=1 Tax=Streptococcus uberis TaxID=1349 RepID=UPI003891488F
MNIAIVDIGSNTIRLNIYRLDKKEYSILFTKKYTASLASYVEDGKLSRDGIDTLKKTISSIEEVTQFIELESIHYFATASLRNVSNQDEVIKEVKDDLNVTIDLLAQSEEARLGHIGIEEVYGQSNGLSIDIGGGSTEIAIFKDKQIVKDFNLSDGSLSYYKKYVEGILPTQDEFSQMSDKVKKSLKKNSDDLPSFDTLIGIGGSVRAIGKVIQKNENLDSPLEFTIDQLKTLSKKLLKKDKKTLVAVFKVAPDRIHTLTPGVVILLEACKDFKVKTIRISNKGIREGYLLDYLNKKTTN